MRTRTRIALLSAVTLVTLGGCGSPSFKSVTWPPSPYRTYGNRVAQVSGEIDKPSSDMKVQATIGGVVVAGPQSLGPNGSFTLSVPLNNGKNDIVVSAGDAGSVSQTVFFPFLTFGTLQEASYVIGQPSMTSSAAGTSSSTLNFPLGNPIVLNQMLLVADSGNSRVVGFPPSSIQSDPATTFVFGTSSAANFLLGQANYDTATTNLVSAYGTYYPAELSVSDNKLFVLLLGSNQVQIFDPIPSSSGTPAAHEVGQASLDQWQDLSCSDDRINGPYGSYAFGSTLLVADTSNNRVLVFDSAPQVDGASARLVLGQQDFTHCNTNRGGPTPTALSLYTPYGVWTDGTRLMIVDVGNGRVLLWNSFPSNSNTGADVVIGQTDATTSLSANLPATQRDTKTPVAVATNGNQIFVADYGFNRVLVWNSFPTSDHQPADQVLGQAGFQCFAANDVNCSGSPGSPSASTFSQPRGLLVTDTQLFVTDTGNNRVLVFDGQ